MANDKMLGNPRLLFITSLYVFVGLLAHNVDANSPPTFFNLPSIINIREDEATGTRVFTMFGFDFDPRKTPEGRVHFILTPTDHTDFKFSVDAANGRMFLVQKLDYETKQSYRLLAEVSDLGTPPLNERKFLDVVVIDVNDNSPMCREPNVIGSLREDADAGASIGTLECTDPDTGDGGIVDFEVVGGDTDVIDVSNTGKATLKRKVDYDTEKPTFEIDVKVKDRGSPQLFSMAKVILSLEDIDDLNPVFSKPAGYSGNVKENTPLGHTVLNLVAVDGDAPNTEASRLRFGLETSPVPDWINVDPFSGSLVVKRNIDWELEKVIECDVYVHSSDKYDERSVVHVTITIDDVNDGIPTFDQVYYEVSVNESTPVNTTVAMINATDVDDGLDGEVSYYIQESSIFHIDNTTGVLSLKEPADYEVRQSYLVTVVAKDGGKPAASNSVFVQVSVYPENEFSPVFVAPFTFDVSEDLTPGSSVFTVSAKDDDAGLDGLVGFQVINSDVPFLIDAGTGVIRVAYDLDFETTTSYNITVEATDNSTTIRKSAQQTFLVNILDANDVAAVCEYVPTLVVKYPFLIGPAITTVVCTDKDTDASALSYNVSIGNDGTFKIANNGILSLVAPPLKNQYELTVEVDDGGGQITSVSFRVFAETALDFHNLPEVITVKESNSLETPPIDTKLGYAFAPVSARFIWGNDLHRLVMTPRSAQIHFALDFDRDIQENYTYAVEALSGSGQNATKIFTVRVEDTNDNPPKFDNTAFLLKVSENLPVTSTIFLFSATDTDADVNAELNYSIPLGNEDGVFAIDQSTGMLSLMSPLHYETRSTYVLEIEASDSGVPSLTGSTTVVINVIDVKEDDPQIVTVSGETEVEISEDAALGSILFRLLTPPSGSPNKVYFDIESGNEDDTFGIESTSGRIYLAKMMDREKRSLFSLNVTAANTNGTKTYSYLNITVTDINDNYPVFSRTVYRFEVLHGEGPGIKVGKVRVTDEDTGDNGNVSISIVNGNTGSSFAFSGEELLTSTTVDFHSIRTYSLVVMAKDHGVPSLYSHAVVNIKVIPIASLPRFISPSVTVKVLESLHIGSLVFDVDATALGASETDGLLRYEIKSGNTENHFSIDLNSGVLSLVKELDYEFKISHSLIISAVNTLDSLKRDEMTLEIDVENVNEFSPSFDLSTYHWSVSESSGVGHLVGTVIVTDKDRGAFGEFETTISGSLDFEIITSNETVRVTRPLDYLRQKFYSFVLTTKDNGVPSRTSVASITIEIIDENDHTPTFSQLSYATQIDSLILKGSEVFHFNAVDLDTGVYGNVSYTITSASNSGIFALDSTTGIVTTTSSPDVTTYTLEVKAEDGDSPPLTSTTRLDITVLRAYGDNNAPSFSNGTVVDVTVPRMATPNHKVAVVAAIDIDPGKFGNLRYYISSGNEDGFFQIDEENGKLTAATWLQTALNSYSLIIKAVDNGKPVLSDSITVNIDINPPRTTSTKTDYTFTVSEDVSSGHQVGRIFVDAGRTVTSYFIVSGNHGNAFIIDTDVSGEGLLKTLGGVDFEEFSLYSLLVQATTDLGNVDKIVEVKVTDVNDEPPQFLTASLSLPLAENMPVGHTLTTLSYEDKDLFEANKAVTFSLTNDGAPFLAIDQSGHLSLLISPDFETTQQFRATVTITQSSFPPASLPITVDVFNIKETQMGIKPPSMRAIFISLELPSQVDKGYVVHTLTLSNFGVNSTESGEYISFDVSPPFAVDQTSGEVTVTNTNGLEADTSYFRWVVCRTATQSSVALLRLDTFDRAKYMIIIEFGNSMDTVKANQRQFIARVQAFFSANYRIGLAFIYEESTSTSARRRLLSSSTPVAVYGVKDNSVDDVDKVDTQKQFLTQSELLQALQQSGDGTPTNGLTDPSGLTVTRVLAYVPSDDSTELFLTSASGIVMLTILVGLTIIVGGVVIYYFVKRSKNRASKSEGEMDDTRVLQQSPRPSIVSNDLQDQPPDHNPTPTPSLASTTETPRRAPYRLEGTYINTALSEDHDETNNSKPTTPREESNIRNDDLDGDRENHPVSDSSRNKEPVHGKQVNALSILPTDEDDEVMERVVVPIRSSSRRGSYV